MTRTERPRRAEGVVLHKVSSEREGERVVLERTGTLFELPLGERDAFVWARLDGTRSLEEVGSDYLEEHGAIHPDLSGLVARLRAQKLLAGEGLPLSPLAERSVGERLARLAGALVMVRLPLPGAARPWSLVGRLSAPFYGAPLGGVGLVLAVLGALFALGPWGSFGTSSLSLLEWPTASGASLLYGVGSLLLLNVVIDKLEAVGQVALLRRGGRGPGRVGVSFDLGVPGIYMDLSDAVLLPYDARIRFQLVPLLTSSALAGLATLAFAWGSGAFGAAPPWGGAEVASSGLVLVHKIAWVAWLRALVQLNPLGPSPLYDALSTWLGIARLRREAWRLLAGGFDLDGVAGLSRREQVVLGYLASIVVYGLSAASLGVFLLQSQLLPSWEAAAGGDLARIALVAGAFLVIALPTLLAAVGGALVLLGAGVEALGQSEHFQSPFRQALLLGGATLGLATAPAFLGWDPGDLPSLLLWFVAAFLALACAAAGARLSAQSGQGWGSLAGDALSLCGLILFAWLGLQALGELRPELRTVTLPGLRIPLGMVSQALILGFGLTSASWALVEVSRTLAIPARVVVLGLLACVLGAPAFVLARPALAVIWGPSALCLATSALLVAASLQARGSQRPLPLLLSAVALAGWAVPTLQSAAGLGSAEAFRGYLPGGVHLPLLTAGLLASAAWTLSQARARPALGPASANLGPVVPEVSVVPEVPGAAACSALSSLLSWTRAALGEGPSRACAGVLEAHALRWDGLQVNDAAQTEPLPLARRGGRALVDLYHAIAARGGDALAEDLLARLALQLSARGHEELAGTAAALLPTFAAIREVPAEERTRLLARVVHFTDFGPAACAELADCLGVVLGEAGELLIRQGEQGEAFFVLVRGSARVVVEDASGEARTVASLSAGDAFGEAALLSHEPRSASVWLVEDSLLLALQRETFAAFLREHPELLKAVFSRQADLSLVREVPLFADLSGGQVAALCQRFAPLRVEGDESVIRQGEAGDRFYLVREGEFEVRVSDEAGQSSTLATLTRGDTFGEIALLRDVPRTASVVACGEGGELLELGRADFHSLLDSGAGARLDAQSARRIEALSASAEDNSPADPPPQDPPASADADAEGASS